MHDEFCTRDETDGDLLSQNCCFRDLDYIKRLLWYRMAAVIKSKGTMSKYLIKKDIFFFLNIQKILYLYF